MGISLRLAGFEIRDSVYWIHGQGFPKSLAIDKQIDKMHGAEMEVIGIKKHSAKQQIEAFKNNGDYILTTQATESAKQWQGMGTALKPAVEPVILARKPIEKGLTIAENCLKWGTGGLSIDDCRVTTDDDLNGGAYRHENSNKDLSNATSYKIKNMDVQFIQPIGRFPANLIHDGSDEVLELFPETKSGGGNGNRKDCTFFTGKKGTNTTNGIDKSKGSAARFFYCPKPSTRERNAGLDDTKNIHTTVKSIALMQYLVKLISRDGQTVLDPFMGSGTTGIAAKNINRSFIGIEREPEYFEIAKARIENATTQSELLI